MKAFSSFILLISSVASSIAFAKPLTPITDAERMARIESLQHSPYSGISVVKRTTKERGCIRTREEISVIDPQTGETRIYALQMIRPEKLKRVPGVIVVPTIQGVTVLEPKVAFELCEKGKAGVIADVISNDLPTVYPSWGYEDQANRWSILALRTTLDYIERHPNIAPDKLGVVGLSLGGIVASMFSAIEAERLKGIVIVVGGANQPFILTTSDQRVVTRLREGRMKSDGIADVAGYEDRLRETIHFDPFYFAPEIRSERVMMFLGDGDKKVPYQSQLELFEAFGRPQSVIFKGGHLASLVTLTYLYMKDVNKFLDKQFAEIVPTP